MNPTPSAGTLAAPPHSRSTQAFRRWLASIVPVAQEALGLKWLMAANPLTTVLRRLLLLLLMLPAVMEAQYSYWTYKNTTTITGYTGPGGAVTIPSTINGLPVTSIGAGAFWGCSRLTNVTIPTSITDIGNYAFELCTNLASVTIPNSITRIGDMAFSDCASLTSVTIPDSITTIKEDTFNRCSNLISVTIPNSVTNIEDRAFDECSKLTTLTIDMTTIGWNVHGLMNATNVTDLILGDRVKTIGDWAFLGYEQLTNISISTSVTNIGDSAFSSCTRLSTVTIPSSVISMEGGPFSRCTSLTGVYFKGNAPRVSGLAFHGDNKAIIYYLPGTTGWSSTFAGRPAVLWKPQVQTSGAHFGVRTNQFGFTVTGNSSLVLVVEASTDLANPTWSPLQTNTLSGDSFYFSDPQWKNYPIRFYRLHWP